MRRRPSNREHPTAPREPHPSGPRANRERPGYRPAAIYARSGGGLGGVAVAEEVRWHKTVDPAAGYSRPVGEVEPRPGLAGVDRRVGRAPELRASRRLEEDGVRPLEFARRRLRRERPSGARPASVASPAPTATSTDSSSAASGSRSSREQPAALGSALVHKIPGLRARHESGGRGMRRISPGGMPATRPKACMMTTAMEYATSVPPVSGGGVSPPLPAMAAMTQSVCDTSRAESSAFMNLKVSRADSLVEGRSTKQDAPLKGRSLRAQRLGSHSAASRRTTGCVSAVSKESAPAAVTGGCASCAGPAVTAA